MERRIARLLDGRTANDDGLSLSTTARCIFGKSDSSADLTTLFMMTSDVSSSVMHPTVVTIKLSAKPLDEMGKSRKNNDIGDNRKETMVIECVWESGGLLASTTGEE